HLGRRLRTVGPATAHHPALEGDGAATRTRTDDLALDLEHVAGAYRCLELNVRIGGEQALVAVVADAQLGGDIAEQAQRVRAVDQIAGVVSVRVRDVPAIHELHAAAFRVGRARAWTR